MIQWRRLVAEAYICAPQRPSPSRVENDINVTVIITISNVCASYLCDSERDVSDVQASCLSTNGTAGEWDGCAHCHGCGRHGDRLRDLACACNNGKRWSTQKLCNKLITDCPTVRPVGAERSCLGVLPCQINKWLPPHCLRIGQIGSYVTAA